MQQTFRQLYSCHQQWQFKNRGDAHLNTVGEMKWRETNGSDSYVMVYRHEISELILYLATQGGEGQR